MVDMDVAVSQPQIRPTTVVNRRTLLESAMDIIRARYSEDLQIDPIAAEIFTSRRQLQRVFSEGPHGSFRNAVLDVRMDIAAQMLASTNQTVRQVAAAVGYRQPAQFAKAFRRKHGVSPSEYRLRPAPGPSSPQL